jgi:hypothetical protein
MTVKWIPDPEGLFVFDELRDEYCIAKGSWGENNGERWMDFVRVSVVHRCGVERMRPADWEPGIVEERNRLKARVAELEARNERLVDVIEHASVEFRSWGANAALRKCLDALDERKTT